MSIFNKKREISRKEFREILRKSPPYIPGSGGKMITQHKRVKMEREIFGQKYGSHISKQEYQRRLRELQMERYRAKTGAEKLDINRKIRFLKKLGGI